MFGESRFPVSPSILLAAIFAASITLVVSLQQDGDLRLVGLGANKFSGRLEIFYDGQWGTVCAAGPRTSSFNFDAATVACRQMGLGDVVDLYTIHHNSQLLYRYGEGTGPIFLDNVRCSGPESHLLRCRHRELGRVSDRCSHNTDVVIVCSNVTSPYNGEVRLRQLPSSTSQSQGLVELYSDGQWASLCYNSQGAELMANVTCRQLGYTHAISNRAYTVPNSRPFWDATPIDCSQAESCLTECWLSLPTATVTTGGCGGQAMLLQCGYNVSIAPSLLPGSYSSCHKEPSNHEGAVRIISTETDSSSSIPSGLLEIYKDGAWANVCDSNVNSLQEEGVVCKQLGFPAAEMHIAYDPSTMSDAETGTVYDIQCTGLESSISECNFVLLDGECPPGQLLMHVTCSRFYPPNGSVILSDGIGSRGTLLVWSGEFFFPVCTDNFSTAEGQIACQQLGYQNLHKIQSSSYYGPSTHTSMLNNFLISTGSCFDSNQLISCLSETYSPSEQCREGLDEVVLLCDDGGSDINVRLVGENAPIQGRLEVNVGEEWGTVCATGEREFGFLEASVVCRSLGYATAAQNPYLLDGSSNKTVHLDSVACSGFEESIFECQLSFVGEACSREVGIKCNQTLGVSNGSLRLAGGESFISASEGYGRLEIAYYGIWMTVCGNYFSDEAAEVACRQLGYTSVVSVCKNSTCYGEGEGFIRVSEDSCTGEERTLEDCNGKLYNSQLCNHSQDVGLQCAGYLTTTTTSSMPSDSVPISNLYIILAAVGSIVFLALVVIVIVCCVCCVYRWKKSKKEGTWTSPGYRNGGVPGASTDLSPSNTFSGLHLNNGEKSKQEQYDDALDIVADQQSDISLSKRPNSPAVMSNGNSPISSRSPNHYHSTPNGRDKMGNVSPRHCDAHVYQNVTEIRTNISSDEPPPNYDDLDLFPSHGYHIEVVSTSAAGISSSLPGATYDSGLGGSTHESDHKEDLRLAPPVSPGRQETML